MFPFVHPLSTSEYETTHRHPNTSAHRPLFYNRRFNISIGGCGEIPYGHLGVGRFWPRVAISLSCFSERIAPGTMDRPGDLPQKIPMERVVKAEKR
jgi:hypothetical protein